MFFFFIYKISFICFMILLFRCIILSLCDPKEGAGCFRPQSILDPPQVPRKKVSLGRQATTRRQDKDNYQKKKASETKD